MTLENSEIGLTPDVTVGAAMRHPAARELLEARLPELRISANQMILGGRPLGLVVATSPSLVGKEDEVRELWDALALLSPALETHRVPEPRAATSDDYESGDVPFASAPALSPTRVSQYGRFELELQGPSHGNPYIDVSLTMLLRTPSSSVEVTGFYDGDGTYRVRYLPEELGEHRFETSSNARSLTGIAGGFEVQSARSDVHGPVRVDRTYHFAHADGTRYLPVGTTAYAWTHQTDELEERTLDTLLESPFNKIRMGIFPKSYLYNANEPAVYPFQGNIEQGFDFQRFDVAYWRHLELRIEQLEEIGVQADLILFHPYDRWGFSTMDAVADDRYLQYAVARLASFSNVWWSLANEYDLLPSKSVDDWERFASIVTATDPSRHLLSIHNCFDFYDYSRPWVTHASIQRQDLYKTSEMTTQWREQWHKPVVIDECAYEGDIDQGWGNITGEEMVRRFWEGAVRGGYVGHGETYLNTDEILWWSKGGHLRGSSPRRIEFLRHIIEAAPRALEPLTIDWDVPSAGVEGKFYLFYFGSTQPRFRRFLFDPSVSYAIDVIDTWQMTVERLPGSYSGRFQIDLPGRSFMALRFVAEE